MVGNDIVDLAVAEKESNWQRPRFLNKIFALKERQRIKKSKNPFIVIWQLWSAKEAAYKLYTQLKPSRFYNPKAFECAFQNESWGVRFKDFECFTQSKATSKYVLSEARMKPFKMNSEVIRFSQNDHTSQSEITKQALMQSISNKYNISVSELQFQKSEFGIPSVSFNSEKISVSLSHHGGFGAYAFQLTNQLSSRA